LFEWNQFFHKNFFKLHTFFLENTVGTRNKAKVEKHRIVPYCESLSLLRASFLIGGPFPYCESLSLLWASFLIVSPFPYCESLSLLWVPFLIMSLFPYCESLSLLWVPFLIVSPFSYCESLFLLRIPFLIANPFSLSQGPFPYCESRPFAHVKIKEKCTILYWGVFYCEFRLNI